MQLPADPYMALSILNTKLRDFYATLEECCQEEELDLQLVVQKLETVGYTYNPVRNQFVSQKA